MQGGPAVVVTARRNAATRTRAGATLAPVVVLLLLAHVRVPIAGGVEGRDEYRKPRRLGTVEDEAIVEVSGIVASGRDARIAWVHNDSGDGPFLYAVDRSGRVRVRLRVSGALATDWEDVAKGYGPPAVRGVGETPTRCLFIADTGNNSLHRRVVTIYRVREPWVTLGESRAELVSEPAIAFPFRFEDGPHDCESLVIDPATGDGWLFTKDPIGVGVYHLRLRGEPSAESRPAVARRVTRLALGGMATAAAISPGGSRLAIRFYWGIAELSLVGGEPVLRDLRGATVRWLGAPGEVQGEAIAYTADGAILTISEGRNPALWSLDPVVLEPPPSGGESGMRDRDGR